MPETINVEEERMVVSKAPNRLRTEVVADCLVLALHDGSEIGGFSHIYLATTRRKILFHNFRYPFYVIFGTKIVTADTVVKEMLSEMQECGSNLKNVTAKMAGEQERYFSYLPFPHHSGGDEKSRTVKRELQKHNIPVVAEDLGGSRYRGRTIEFDLATQELGITYVEKIIEDRGSVIDFDAIRPVDYKLI